MARTTITTNDGKIDYVDPSIACYLSYPCAYCLIDFILLDPDYNFQAGGAIQRQVLSNECNHIYALKSTITIKK